MKPLTCDGCVRAAKTFVRGDGWSDNEVRYAVGDRNPEFMRIYRALHARHVAGRRER